MENFYFWDSEVWGIVNLVAVLLITMLVANILKKSIQTSASVSSAGMEK